MHSYEQRKKKNVNKRQRERKKRRHAEKCEIYMNQRKAFYNDILFDEYAKHVLQDGLNFKECKLNHILQKERVMQDLKKQREIISECKILNKEPYEYVEHTKHDIPQRTWINYLFGY